MRRVAVIVKPLALLAMLYAPLILVAAPAMAACSDTVPFFTYGSCSHWKESRLEKPQQRQWLFAPANGGWRVNSSSSSGERDISTTATFSDSGGKGGRAQFAIRCLNDTTTARFKFAGYEMGNKGAQREIVYQVDDRDEAIIELERAGNHEVLSVQQGYRAVPFVRELIGGRKLKISAIAANGKELRAVLRLDGLDEAIGGLRSACHW
ncbi:MAG: type VI secretion protein [Salaquimonas sp.]|jgi:hypothetical protein|nr:type VI secretion protein [Salaquimonas sp.]